MSVQTRGQRLARAAHDKVAARATPELGKEYTSFARRFPALVHSCGLAQAVAFAAAKKEHRLEYLEDLEAVLAAGGHTTVSARGALANRTRAASVASYLRLSRDALEAATWLKRYVEAYSMDSPKADPREGDSRA